MANVLTTITIPSVTGVPADSFVNTWHWSPAAAPDAALMNTIEGRIAGFYNDVHAPGVNSLANYFSKEASRVASACTAKSYILPAAPGDIGSPDHVSHFSLADIGGGQELPAEVALCLSYHGSLVDVPEKTGALSDIPSTKAARRQGAPATHPGHARMAERRRGRIYLGPLNTSCCGIGVGGAGRQRPSATFMADVAGAAVALNADLATLGAPWSVFSRRDWSSVGVVGGFVDDAFDTQRRRGAKATARNNW